jgi:hypothetical protein
LFFIFFPPFLFFDPPTEYIPGGGGGGGSGVCVFTFFTVDVADGAALPPGAIFFPPFFSLLSAFIFLYNCTTTPTFSSQYDLTLCSRFLLLLPQQLRVPRGRENIFIFSLSLIHLEGMYNDFIETFIKHFI